MNDEDVKVKRCETAWAKVYIAGSVPTLEQVCREFCLDGCCVTVTPTNYIYTFGEESGAEIGLIHYPRFPKGAGAQEQITRQATNLGFAMMYRCHQGSFTVMDPEMTYFHSRRKGE